VDRITNTILKVPAKTFSLIALPGYTASVPDQLLYGGFDHYFLSSSA
jgi:hypothetical protein